MDKIKIITDSCADIKKEMVDKFNISVLPMHVTIDGNEYKDFYEISHEQFFDILRNSDKNTSFSTSQVNADAFYEEFKKCTTEGYKIICYTISSAGSGTFQNANIAKKMLLDEMQADIEIIDSMHFTYVYGRIVVKAAEMVMAGASKEDILKKSRDMIKGCDVVFVLDTLKFLKKGGRINPAVAAIGEILDIKPVLSVTDGVICNVDKIRGRKKVVPRILEIIEEKGFNKDSEIYVLYGGNLEQAQEMAQIYADKFNILRPELAEIGPAVAAHTGCGVLGAIIFNKL